MLPTLALLSTALAIIQVPVAFRSSQVPAPQVSPEPGLDKRGTLYDPLEFHKAAWFSLELLFGSQKSPGKPIFDTGSYNTWIDTDSYQLQESTTGKNLSEPYDVVYVGLTAKGWFVEDDVFLNGNKLHFKFGSVPPGLAYPGVMGVAPIPTDSPTANTSIVNVLKTNGLISSRSYSVWMTTTTEGTVTFGGIDHTKYTGSLYILPIWRRPGHLDDGFGLGVRKWYAYDEQRGESALLMEGLQKCAIDTGTDVDILPQAVADGLATAFNLGQAKNHPDAKAAGFQADDWVYKYTGDAGIAIDVQGIILKLPMKKWLRDANGNWLTGDLEVGKWYKWWLTTSSSYCILGQHSFYQEYFMAADYEHMEVAIAVANTAADPSTSQLQEIGTQGFATFSATRAPDYSDTLAKPTTAYSPTWSSS